MSFVHKISSKRMSRKKGKINKIAIDNQNENSVVIFKFYLKMTLKLSAPFGRLRDLKAIKSRVLLMNTQHPQNKFSLQFVFNCVTVH